MKLIIVTAKEGQLTGCANRKQWRSANAGENGISNGEREIWLLCNVNTLLGQSVKSNMRLAIKYCSEKMWAHIFSENWFPFGHENVFFVF